MYICSYITAPDWKTYVLYGVSFVSWGANIELNPKYMTFKLQTKDIEYIKKANKKHPNHFPSSSILLHVNNTSMSNFPAGNSLKHWSLTELGELWVSGFHGFFSFHNFQVENMFPTGFHGFIWGLPSWKNMDFQTSTCPLKNHHNVLSVVANRRWLEFPRYSFSSKRTWSKFLSLTNMHMISTFSNFTSATIRSSL